MRAFKDEIINETDGHKRYDLVDRHGNVIASDVWLRQKSQFIQQGSTFGGEKDANFIMFRDECETQYGTASFSGTVAAGATYPTQYITLSRPLIMNNAEISFQHLLSFTISIRNKKAVIAKGGKAEISLNDSAVFSFGIWGRLANGCWSSSRRSGDSGTYVGLESAESFVVIKDCYITDDNRIGIIFQNVSSSSANFNCNIFWEAY